MNRRAALAVTTLLLAGANAVAHANSTAPVEGVAPAVSSLSLRPDDLRIARAGSKPSAKGPADYFTGSVRVDMLFSATPPSCMTGGSVTFEPGARSAWHTHPVGQVLVVTAGLGWIQRMGSAVEEMRPGDVVWIAPGVKHWHGAAATTGVTHIALTEAVDGQVADWMEKVSDEQYRR